MVAEFFSQPLVVVISALLAGAAAGAWTHHLIPAKPGKSSRADTRLRVKIDPAGTGHFVEEYSANIGGWRQSIATMSVGGIKTEAQTLSIVFEDAAPSDRPIVEAHGGKLPGYNYWPMGDRGAVFQFVGEFDFEGIDIWFALENSDYERVVNPTHWMPLPEPPNA